MDMVLKNKLIYSAILSVFLIGIISAGFGYDTTQSPLIIYTNVTGGGGGNGTSVHNDLTGLQGGSAAQYFHLNSSIYTYLLANIYGWSSNVSGGGGNTSWNQSFANTLYAPYGSVGNSSWNQSFADTLYPPITQNLSDLLNIGNDAGGQNIVNLADPINLQDAVTVTWATTNLYNAGNFVDGANYWSPASLTDDSQLGNGAGYLTAETDPLSLHLNGDNLMANNIDLSNTYSVINVLDPINLQDVMTLNYSINNYASIVWGYNQSDASAIYTDEQLANLNNNTYLNFVPYIGALQDLDLGLNNFTTLGRLSSGNIFKAILGDDLNLFAGLFSDGIRNVTISNGTTAITSTDGITTTILNDGTIAGQFTDLNNSIRLADGNFSFNAQGNGSLNGTLVMGDNQYIQTVDTYDGLTDSGSLTIKTGDTQNNNTGSIIIKSGFNNGVAGSARTGDINISTSESQDGLSGNINIIGGYSTGNGAMAGNGDNSGAINIIAGENGNAGVSGMINIVGGSGGGDPGTVTICGGSGGDTSGNVLLSWSKLTNLPRGFVGIRNSNPLVALDVNGEAIINSSSAFTPTLTINAPTLYASSISINATGRINTASAFSVNNTIGMTNSTGFWMCKDSLCTAKCQAIIKGGLITACT